MMLHAVNPTKPGNVSWLATGIPTGEALPGILVLNDRRHGYVPPHP